jgi:hypothetical protein
MDPIQSIIARLQGYRKPWLVRKAWRERRIVSHGARGCFFVLAIIFFGSMAFLGFTIALYNVSKNPEGAATGLFVGAISGGFLAVVTYSWRNWRKFGKSVCHLETLPGVIGGWFKASVEVKLPADVTPVVKVKLENFTIEWWRPRVRIRFTRIQGDRYMVPVRFQIPARKDYYETWQLKVRAEFPGVNLRADFIVPIFKT